MDYGQDIIATLERILLAAEETGTPSRVGKTDPAQGAIRYIETCERKLDEIYHLAEEKLCELREEDSNGEE